MGAYFYISEQAVIAEGRLVKGKGFEYDYIIYVNGSGEVQVNTYYQKIKKNVYNCCIYYDRKICGKREDLENIPPDIIENQIYGSYMDGAR